MKVSQDYIDNLNNLKIDENLFLTCFFKHKQYCDDIKTKFKYFITEKCFVKKCLLEKYLNSISKDKTFINREKFHELLKFLEKGYVFKIPGYSKS